MDSDNDTGGGMAHLHRLMWFFLGVALVAVPLVASAKVEYSVWANSKWSGWKASPAEACETVRGIIGTSRPWELRGTFTAQYPFPPGGTGSGLTCWIQRVTEGPISVRDTCDAGTAWNNETKTCELACVVGEVVSSGYYPIDGEDGQPNTPACQNQCELVFEGGTLHTTTSGQTGETLFYMQGEYQKTGQNCTDGDGPSQPQQPPAPECPPGYYSGEVNGQKTCKPEDKPPEDEPPPPFECPDGMSRRYNFVTSEWTCVPKDTIPECEEGTSWNGASCKPHPGCSSGFVKNDIGQCIQVQTNNTNTNTNTTTTTTTTNNNNPGDPGTTNTESGPGESTTTTTVTKVNEDGTKTVVVTTQTTKTETKPDPNDPTKTITEEKTETKTETKVEQPTYKSTACGSTPACTGDAIQCAIAREAHAARCRDEKIESDGQTYLQGVGDVDVNQARVDEALNTSGAFDFDISARFAEAQGNYVTFTAECLPSVGFSFKGQTYTFNTEFLCEIAVFVRILMHIVAYTAVLAMVSRAFGGI